MTLGALSLVGNDLLAVSDPTAGSITLGPEQLLLLVVLGGIAGIWLFLKLIALASKLLLPLAIGAVLTVLHQQGLPIPFGQAEGAGSGQPASTSVTPVLGDFLPR
jgi:hypothetical protein